MDQCRSWLDMKGDERNWWRRGISAYNSGPIWVMRAIKSAHDERTKKDTAYLSKEFAEARKNYKKYKEYFKGYKEYPLSWEQLRVYYFLEKLSPKNTSKTKTGRKLSSTVLNIAHTEAILGREVKVEDAPPSMVEIWSQYIRNNKPSCN